jgi:hypothetical protein
LKAQWFIAQQCADEVGGDTAAVCAAWLDEGITYCRIIRVGQHVIVAQD